MCRQLLIILNSVRISRWMAHGNKGYASFFLSHQKIYAATGNVTEMDAHMEIKPCVSWLLMTYIRIFVARIEIYYSGKDTQTKRIFFICVIHAHAIPDSSCRHLGKSSIYKSSTPGFTNCWCVKRSYNCLPGRVIPHDPDFLYKLHKIQSDEKTKYTMHTYIRPIELAVKREGRKWKKKEKN